MDADAVFYILKRLARCLRGMLVIRVRIILDIRFDLLDVDFIIRGMQVEHGSFHPNYCESGSVALNWNLPASRVKTWMVSLCGPG